MFIEIESSYKLTPQLIFKGSETGVVKKPQIKVYSDAKALLTSIENRVDSFQNKLETETNRLIEEKESELAQHVEKLKLSAEQQMIKTQDCWFEQAEQKLKSLLSSQEERLNNAVLDVKKKAEKAVYDRLVKMNQSDNLIQYLIDALHNEINDLEKSLEVVQTHNDQGTSLTIENDDCVITINTQELLSELKNCIENMSYV
ncbi:hypothetical protein [Providencia sneebia]|uniref:Uncharacterized protein n=1 Tax=Providencia sneebia DSM 19967 TaxID=1141660 RepID=K8WHM6_9GAMM|nr:hypothetical protein [Providencia sneebia]EKT60083.1 hypothetical protein OO7_04609 [Providencia sneebia DSM 19967]